jgi:hypothetical protein
LCATSLGAVIGRRIGIKPGRTDWIEIQICGAASLVGQEYQIARDERGYGQFIILKPRLRRKMKSRNRLMPPGSMPLNCEEKSVAHC